MTNYDCIKGYRGFRFEKHPSIDSSLPTLSSYRSTRETNSILNISNTQRVQATKCQSWPDNHSHSLRVSAKLSTAVEPMLSSAEEYNYSVAPRELSEGTNTNATLIAISPAPFQSQKERQFSKYKAAKPHTPSYGSPYGNNIAITGRRTIFSQKCRDERRSGNMRTINHAASEKKGLSECLIIHNGIERAPGHRARISTTETKPDNL